MYIYSHDKSLQTVKTNFVHTIAVTSTKADTHAYLPLVCNFWINFINYLLEDYLRNMFLHPIRVLILYIRIFRYSLTSKQK